MSNLSVTCFVNLNFVIFLISLNVNYYHCLPTAYSQTKSNHDRFLENFSDQTVSLVFFLNITRVLLFACFHIKVLFVIIG